MLSNFNAEFFRANRARLRQAYRADGPIVVTAHALLQRSGDAAQPFRQDGSFWYLTGINEPEIVLVIDTDREYLIVPERTAARNVFDGAIDVAAMSRRSGVGETLNWSAGWRTLTKRLKESKKAGVLSAPTAYIKHFEFYTNPARAELLKTIKSTASGIELTKLNDNLTEMRCIKQPAEIQAIQSAVSLTIEAFKSLEAKLDRFRYEYEVEAHLYHSVRSRGACFGYQPIVASGKRAVILHYDANDGRLEPGSLLLVDCGAQFDDYTADITRVFAIASPTVRQKEVLAAVESILNFSLSLIKPGISIKEIDLKARRQMSKALKDLGLIKQPEETAVRKYFPHALSHYLGLDVHDVGYYSQPLAVGMVLTVEPGIYIAEEGIGVRLEDDVVVTEDGCRNLSGGLPLSLG